MFTLFIFIGILSVLVLIHEFGHFYTAKKTGVQVEEFGFGLPPRVFGKKFKGTLYSLNLLPFGGFVKLTGEDVDEEVITLKEAKADPKNFASKTPGQRALIISAGVLMNLFLAIFLYYVFLFFTGFRSFNIPMYFDHHFRFGYEERFTTVVLGLEEGAPAEQAGINMGEAIIELNGTQVYNLNDIRAYLADKVGQEVSVLLMDVRSFDKPIRTVVTTVTADDEGNGVLGVYIGDSVTLHYGDTKIVAGIQHTYNMTAYTTRTFGKLIQSAFAQRDLTPVSSSVAGPVGIFSIVGGILKSSSYPALSILDLIALLSITLAIVNILPLPALDGGRLVFIVYEKVRGKRINPRTELAIHKVGLLVLLAVLVLVTIRDISRII